jgi:hypothetical protein
MLRIVAGALALVLLACLPAQARHHRHHHHHVFGTGGSGPVHCDDRYLPSCDVRGWHETRRHPWKHQNRFNAWAAPVAASGSRPRDCYGIPWCGCWLRTYFGIADRSLNLAINWARRGAAATIETANVVVWRHHVGRLLEHRNGMILVQSGNDGGAVRTRWMSPHKLGGVVAYRRV